MGLFDKKPSYRRDEMRGIFEKSSGHVPFGGGRNFNRVERGKIFQETFGRELDVSKGDYQRAVKRLSQQSREVKDLKSKRGLVDRMKFLRDLEKKS